MTTLGKRIRDARHMKDYSQVVLAHKVKVNKAYISQWENDHKEPTQEQMARLEKVLGPLDDMAEQIREMLEWYSVPDIAREAGKAVATIYNILKGVGTPHPETIDKIEKALSKLRERHRDDAQGEGLEDISYEDPVEDSESESPFELHDRLYKELIGEEIKSIRAFNPYSKKQLNELPDTPGVYLIYAGNNNLAIDLKSALKRNKTTTPDKLMMVGTPEYIGQSKTLKTRIMSHHRNRGKGDDWWWLKGFIDLGICIETDGNGKLHKDLETLLIKLMSPQINKRKRGV